MGLTAVIAKLAFVGLLIAGIVSGELRRKRLAVFVALGAFAWFGGPYRGCPEFRVWGIA